MPSADFAVCPEGTDNIRQFTESTNLILRSPPQAGVSKSLSPRKRGMDADTDLACGRPSRRRESLRDIAPPQDEV
jgi:hypothetical protein